MIIFRILDKLSSTSLAYELIVVRGMEDGISKLVNDLHNAILAHDEETIESITYSLTIMHRYSFLSKHFGIMPYLIRKNISNLETAPVIENLLTECEIVSRNQWLSPIVHSVSCALLPNRIYDYSKMENAVTKVITRLSRAISQETYYSHHYRKLIENVNALIQLFDTNSWMKIELLEWYLKRFHRDTENAIILEITRNPNDMDKILSGLNITIIEPPETPEYQFDI